MADYFSFDDVMRELELSEDELKRMVSEGEIRAFRSGGGMKFRPEDIETMRRGRTSEPTVILPGEPSKAAEDDVLDLDIDSEIQALSEAETATAPAAPKPVSASKLPAAPKPPSRSKIPAVAKPPSASKIPAVPKAPPPPKPAPKAPEPEPELELEPLDMVEEPAPPKVAAPPKAAPKPAPAPAGEEEPMELLSEEDVQAPAEPEVELEPEVVEEAAGKPAAGETELDLGDLEVQPDEGGEAQETFVEEEGEEVGTETAPLALADESGGVAEAETEEAATEEEEAPARAHRGYGGVAVAEAAPRVKLWEFLVLTVVLIVTVVGFGVTLGMGYVRNNIATGLGKWRGDTHWSNPDWKGRATAGMPEAAGEAPETGGMTRVTFTEPLESAPATPGP